MNVGDDGDAHRAGRDPSRCLARSSGAAVADEHAGARGSRPRRGLALRRRDACAGTRATRTGWRRSGRPGSLLQLGALWVLIRLRPRAAWPASRSGGAPGGARLRDALGRRPAVAPRRPLVAAPLRRLRARLPAVPDRPVVDDARRARARRARRRRDRRCRAAPRPPRLARALGRVRRARGRVRPRLSEPAGPAAATAPGSCARSRDRAARRSSRPRRRRGRGAQGARANSCGQRGGDRRRPDDAGDPLGHAARSGGGAGRGPVRGGARARSRLAPAPVEGRRLVRAARLAGRVARSAGPPASTIRGRFRASRSCSFCSSSRRCRWQTRSRAATSPRRTRSDFGSPATAARRKRSTAASLARASAIPTRRSCSISCATRTRRSSSGSLLLARRRLRAGPGSP